jgi:hypothetical protein
MSSTTTISASDDSSMYSEAIREESYAFYCRVGKHGQIGRFRDIQQKTRVRGEQVLVRTRRGVEPATILSAVSKDHFSGTQVSHTSDLEPRLSVSNDEVDGKILRTQTPEDQMLLKQLMASASSAAASCQRFLDVQQTGDCLLDVEPMMDGKTLYFHFVGVPEDAVTEHLQELAEIFQRDVQESQFAKLLEHGCGPGCGTEEKGGCGEGGSCTVCVIAKACSSKT